MTTAKEVLLTEGRQKTEASIGVKVRTKGQRPSGGFVDVHINDNLIIGRPTTGLNIGVGKEAKRTDTFSGFTNGTRVKGIALYFAELLAHHTVERGVVAFNVDTLHENAFAAYQRIGHIKRKVAVISGNARFDLNKLKAALQRQTLQTGNVVFDIKRRVGRARTGPNGLLEFFEVGFGDFRNDINRAKVELLPLFNVKGNQIGITATGQLNVHIINGEVDIATRLIEVGQNAFIEINAVRNVSIAANNRAQDTCLLGGQHATKTTVRETAVASEADPFHLSHAIFCNFENNVNAVVGQTDDARCYDGVDPPLICIGCRNVGNVSLNAAWTVNPAFLRAKKRKEFVILQAAVAFKVDAIHGRVFRYGDDQLAAARLYLYRFKQSCCANTLARIVKFGGRYGLTLRDAQIAKDRCGFDPLVPLDRDGVHGKGLRPNR